MAAEFHVVHLEIRHRATGLAPPTVATRLFVRGITEFFDEENPIAFQKYYQHLRDELQPIGPCEESEVEYIAICWLKLQRLWKYENAEVQAGQDTIMRNQENGLYDPLASPIRARQLSLLYEAKEQAERSGQVSPDLMEKMISDDPSIEYKWRIYEAEAEKTARKKRREIVAIIAKERNIPVSEAASLLKCDPKSLPERKRFIALETVSEIIRLKQREWANLSRREISNEYRRQLIPDGNEVDKIIRYQSAVERQLSRSYDRLERLQRRRQGELVPPPVTVRLTQ